MPTTLSSSLFYSGLHFGEGPRVHGGELWCSDMHAQQVLKFDASGNATKVVDVESDPSGLGWLPNGQLLVVSMRDRRVLRWDGEILHDHADLSHLAPWHCNDMVVDRHGRAYVGNFGFDLPGGNPITATNLIRVDPNGSITEAANDLLFPNGTVITPDGATLIVGETFGRRLTAFDIDDDGNLSNRRTWAELENKAVPDGICLDEAGGIWVASPTTNDCLRIIEGGEVTHRVAFDRGAYACILHGNSLYSLTAKDSRPDVCRATTDGRIEVSDAPYAGAGWP